MKEISSKILTILKETDNVFSRFHTITNSNKILKYYLETEEKLLEGIEIDNTALKIYFYYMELCLLTAEKILYNNGEYLDDRHPDIFKKAENYLYKAVDLFKQMKKLIGKYEADHPYYVAESVIYSFYAKVLFHLSKKDEAIKYFKKAIQKKPDDLYSLNMVAVLLMETNKYNEAEEYLHKILKKDRYNYLALSNLGEIAKEKMEFRKAKIYYEAALEANSEDAFSQMELEKIQHKVPKPPVHNLEMLREEAFKLKYATTSFIEYIDDNGKYINQQEAIKFEVKNIGDININSGKIMTCDMSFMDEDYVFTEKFPKGDFPVELAIAHFNENEDERIAFIRIKFSEKNPIKWKIGQFKKKYTEYGVDSGKACLLDISYKEKYLSILENIKLHEKLIDDVEKNYKDTRSWMMLNKKDLSVAVFSTGYGDGGYESYMGYDKDNKICRLVTDFQIIINEDES